MILHEFAVEPGCVAESFERFRYITEKFGFDHGRVISRLPARWEKAVLDQTSEKGVGRSRMVAKLRQMKRQSLISRSRAFDPNLDWLCNAETNHDSDPFHAVLAEKNPRDRGFVFRVCNLAGDLPPLSTPREERVPRTASALAASIELLLQVSREVIFVDPYFDPGKRRWQNTLREFLRVATERGHQLLRCEYHLRDKLGLAYFQSQIQSRIEPIIPAGLSIKFIRWSDAQTEAELHPRYVLTDLGGVRIEHGLDEKPGGANTDVSLLDQQLWNARWADYQRDSSPFSFADETTAVGRD